MPFISLRAPAAAHLVQSSIPIYASLLFSLLWSVVWLALFRFALPKIAQKLLQSQLCQEVLQRQRVMLSEIGFTHAIAAKLSDHQVANMFSWMVLTAAVHLAAALCAFPAAQIGWFEAGVGGHVLFYIATWMIFGLSLFSFIDETFRCLLPSCEGRLSGMVCPCPRPFWVLICTAYHPFWLTLVLPMNEVASQGPYYHMLVWVMLSVGGVQLSCRQLGLLLGGMKDWKLLPKGVAIVNVLIVIACRGIFYFPSAIDCVQRLASRSPVQKEAFMVAALLTGCFNVAAILDAMKVLVGWRMTTTAQSRPLYDAENAPGLGDSLAGEEMHAAIDDERHNARPARQSKKGSRSKRSSGLRGGSKKARRVIDEENVDGEVTFGFEGDEADDPVISAADAVINDTPKGEDPFEACGSCRNTPPQRASPSPAAAGASGVAGARKEFIRPEITSPTAPTKSTAAAAAAPKAREDSSKSREVDHAALYESGRLARLSHYAILGLKKEATAEEIKRAFHQLSRKWHPDKNPEDTARAEAIFRAIKEGYECLSDATKRRRYDMLRRSHDL